MAFYSQLLSRLDTALGSFVTDTATNVIGAITPVATTLGMIYVMMWGWAMMRGVISEPVMDGVNRIVRIALITGLALQLGNYNGYIADFLWQSPEALSAIVHGGAGGAVSNVQYLDDVWTKVYAFGSELNKEAIAKRGPFGIPDLSLMASSWAIWGAGIAATGYAAFLLALAKMGLAIMLGLGPIFILLIMFESTKRFFDAWLGQALNFVFMVLLSAAGIKLILSLLMAYLNSADLKAGVDTAIPGIVFAIIGCLVLMQVPAMASALGGGVSVGTLGAVNWAMNKTASTAEGMRPSNLRRSFRKAALDAKIIGDLDKKVAAPALAVGRAMGRAVGIGTNNIKKR